MSKRDKTREQNVIRSIATGVPGLDDVLGGGLPEYSFNLIAGGPGAGKTTLVQQIMFANATVEKPAVYFTVLGEPTLKMLRYQRQFGFFDVARVGSAVRFINLSEETLQQNLDLVLNRIVNEVEKLKPGIVIVDSFRTLGKRAPEDSMSMELEHFVQRLAMHLTTWEVTSFLIGEYVETEQRNPVFTVADGVFWLSQVVDRNSVVRKFQVVKVRGRQSMPGLHNFRITEDGVQLFPRIPEQQRARLPQTVERQSTGVPGLDEMMGGGIPAGDAVMLAGPSGSGKTTFATQFMAEGVRQGEGVVVAVFEEYPEEYLHRASGRGVDLHEAVGNGTLKVIYLRPLDLSVDEALAEILAGVAEIDARRVVVDSLSGLEVALAPTFREDFRESLYRLVGALTATGVTVLMTAEIVGGSPDLRISSEKVSFITDDVIVQRYVEIRGQLKKVLNVMKMRGSAHSKEFRTYELGSGGAVVGEPLRDYHGIITGTPELQLIAAPHGYLGLTERETSLLDTLTRMGSATIDQLAERVGVADAELALALERIVALGYAARTHDDDQVYRAIAQ